jgi:hypothetical protein
MPAFLKRLLSVFILAAMVGCAFLTPKSAELEKIHQCYREEFMTTAIPTAIDERQDVACQVDPDGFVRTLQAIRDFQVRYPDVDPAITQHLYVLQAMVFLQSGRPGMARLLNKDFIEKGNITASKGGGFTRDALFADNLENLIDGWTVYCQLITAGGPFNEPAFSDHQRAIEDSAHAIRTYLKTFETKDPAADEGAVYLAASAALFQMWATKIKSDRCLFGKKCEAVGLSDDDLQRLCGGDRDCRNSERGAAVGKAKAREFASYRELIGRFLSEPERRLADSENWQTAAIGRYRYLAVYRYLGQHAAE